MATSITSSRTFSENTRGHEQWTTLLNDALAVCTELPAGGSPDDGYGNIEHFLGSIVVILDGMRAGTVSSLKLVDGQQRLTTISLLLKALGKIIDTARPQLSKKIDKFLVNADERGDIFYKILPTAKSGDRGAYCALMSGAALPEGNSKIALAYAFYERELKSVSCFPDGRQPGRRRGVFLIRRQENQKAASINHVFLAAAQPDDCAIPNGTLSQRASSTRAR